MKIVTFTAAALMLTLLSGCIALVAGAAAGGATGYYIEKQNQTSSQTSNR